MSAASSTSRSRSADERSGASAGRTIRIAEKCFVCQRPGASRFGTPHPGDAKGLLKTRCAIRIGAGSPKPNSSTARGMIERGKELLIPLGEAEVKREGSDVRGLLCATGRSLPRGGEV